MKYQKTSFPFTSLKVRNVRILTQLFYLLVSRKQYKKASVVASYLFPMLCRDSADVLLWLARKNTRKIVNDKLFDYFYKIFDAQSASILQALCKKKTNPKEALTLFEANKFQDWFINSAESHVILSCLYQMNGYTGVKSAKKAFELQKNEITFRNLIYALVSQNNVAEAIGVLKKFKSKDPRTIDFCCVKVSTDWKRLEDIHKRDPRNGEVAVHLMKYYQSIRAKEKVIEVANRHIEYRGSSKQVRSILADL